MVQSSAEQLRLIVRVAPHMVEVGHVMGLDLQGHAPVRRDLVGGADIAAKPLHRPIGGIGAAGQRSAVGRLAKAVPIAGTRLGSNPAGSRCPSARLIRLPPEDLPAVVTLIVTLDACHPHVRKPHSAKL